MSFRIINKNLIDCNQLLLQIKSQLISNKIQSDRNSYVSEYLKDVLQQILIAKNSLEELNEDLKDVNNNYLQLSKEIRTERKLDNEFIKNFLPLMLLHNMNTNDPTI